MSSHIATNTSWKVEGPKKSNKRKAADAGLDDDDDQPITIPFRLPNLGGSSSIYSHANHIYFNDDITRESAFALNRELRHVENRLKHAAFTFDLNNDSVPIFLHLTTNGGLIDAAFSVVDCMNNLSVPVYTIIDGFVASAGTLISLAGKKRYIEENAYFLIHQLSSGVWGKMQEITDEYENLKKLANHLVSYYVDKTKMRKKEIQEQLKHDITWNATEVIARGIAERYIK